MGVLCLKRDTLTQKSLLLPVTAGEKCRYAFALSTLLGYRINGPGTDLERTYNGPGTDLQWNSIGGS